MNILVTGASGFIGGHLVRDMLMRGDTVRALYRRMEIPEHLAQMHAAFPDRLELIRGDLSFTASLPPKKSAELSKWKTAASAGTGVPAWFYVLKKVDVDAAAQLLAGCDACVHVAARAGDWGGFHEYFMHNAHPVRVLLEAALRVKLKRFVHISSIAVHGFGPHRASDETGPYYPVENPYQISKRMAESLVHFAAGTGLSSCIVRPGNVYGPDDTTTSFPIFDGIKKGIMGTIDKGKSLTCPVFVNDLTRAVLSCVDISEKALAKIGAPTAAVFNITDDRTYTWAELLKTMTTAIGAEKNLPDISSTLARPVAVLLEGIFGIVKSKSAPPLTRYRVDQLRYDYAFSMLRAREVLGYRSKVGLQEGMKLTADSWKQHRRELP